MPTSRSIIVLAVSTWAFVVCFAIWLMFGVIGIPIRRELGLNELEFGLLTSTPILTGALFRLPLGIWTDRFGGRIVMFLLLLFCAAPIWLASYATQLWQLLLLGLALGLVGASFAVGTPYVARFFPKERRGFAMGCSALARQVPRSTCSLLRRSSRDSVGRAFHNSTPQRWSSQPPSSGYCLRPTYRRQARAACPCDNNWPFSRTCESGNIASIIPSCLAVLPRSQCGCRITLCRSMD